MKTLTIEDDMPSTARRLYKAGEEHGCPDCGRPARHLFEGMAWCYDHVRSRGAEARRRQDNLDADAFWAKVDKSGECWLWRGHISKNGYGTHWRRVGTQKAHRIAYELTHGPLSDTTHIDHLCVTTACVRPSHLEPVTQAENRRRQALRQTECVSGHPYDDQNTYIDPRGRRDCRACQRARGIAYRARLKEAQA